jgi:hypothetical protein
MPDNLTYHTDTDDVTFQPSSSGRAAELLSRDGVAGFIGFGDAGISHDGSSLQFVPASAEHPEASVHPDFLLTMKKLSKRDAVTKLKVNGASLLFLL